MVVYENQTKDVSFEKRSRHIYFLVENFLYAICKSRIYVYSRVVTKSSSNTLSGAVQTLNK